MVKITAARFDSFLKSSDFGKYWHYHLQISVMHLRRPFFKSFYPTLRNLFPVIVRSYLSLVVYVFQLFKMGDKERQGNKNIHFWALCGGRGGIFCCGWATSWSQESKIRLPSIPVVHYLLFFSHIPRRKFCFTSIRVAAATHTAARQPCFRQSGRN